MRKFTLVFFYLTLIFSASVLSAQKIDNRAWANNDSFISEYVIRSWDSEDGLPGNTVTDIMQSSNGYLYIGTYDGLVRFDGLEFVTLSQRTDERFSFASSRTIFEDSKGNIWNGSNDEGVCKLSKDNDIMVYNDENGLPNNSVRAIMEDKKGNIWIGTTAGISIIDKYGSISKFRALEKFGQDSIKVSSIFCDSDNRIWIFTKRQNGIYIYYNGKIKPFEGLKSFDDSIISTVMQDRMGDLWFGVEPHYAVKVSGNKETIYDIGKGEQPGSTIHSIFEDNSGNIWFALDTGVSVLHQGKWSYFDQSCGLTDDNVSKITQDREGNIWFATNRGGIQMLTVSRFRTTYMNTTINAIAEDTQHKVIWIAGDDGLYCLKNNNFIENDLTQECKNRRIRDVTMTSSGGVLVSCYEDPALIIMESTGNILRLSQNDGLTGNKARMAIQSQNGDIYIGTTTGLTILDKKNQTVHSISKEDGISNEFIMCLYQDKKGEIWCGTDGGGLFTIKDGKLNRQYTTKEGLAGNVVFKITEAESGDYWISTGKGISRLNIENGETFVNYNSKNGLEADGVFQTIFDYSGTVWMTSNRGIFSSTLKEFDAIKTGELSKLSSKLFGQSDGLITEGITSTSKSMQDSRGRIWFTLIDGFTIYDPFDNSTNKTVPIVKIQKIIVDDTEYDYKGQKIILKPSVKRIEIKYTGLSFVSSERMKFRSKLSGFDSDFTKWATERTVSYTNLHHGKYEFTVDAENSDGIRSKNIETVFIEKKPHFYELIWFWIVIAACIIVAVFFTIRHRFHKLKVYQRILEKAVEDRTKELAKEEEKNEALLLNILPKDIVTELKEHPGRTIANTCNTATVLFSDIKGFTKMSDGMDAFDVVEFLNELFTKFDERALKEGVEKIKTIGDSYMAATGLFGGTKEESIIQMMNFAKGMLEDLKEFNKTSKVKISMRIGINCGTIVAGVIGKSKFIYDIWGDTVNVASRMESNGEAEKICVTEEVYNVAKNTFTFTGPKEINIKGKGIMKTYLTEN